MPVFQGVMTTSGGGIRTIDGTTTEAITPPFTGTSLIGSLDMQTLIQVDGTGVQRSVNGGDTWTALAAVPAASNCGLQLNSGTILVVEENRAAGLRVFRSTDGGSSWSSIVIHADVINAAAGVIWELRTGTVLVGAKKADDTGRIYRSTDDGQTWTQVYENPAFQPGMAIGLAGITALLLHRTTTTTKIHKSVDDGATWVQKYESDADVGIIEPVRNGPARVLSDAAWIYFTSVNVVDVGFRLHKHRSTDDGESWVRSSSDVAFPTGKSLGGLIATSASTLFGIFDVAGFGIHKSTDLGATWSALIAGTTVPAAMTSAVTARYTRSLAAVAVGVAGLSFQAFRNYAITLAATAVGVATLAHQFLQRTGLPDEGDIPPSPFPPGITGPGSQVGQGGFAGLWRPIGQIKKVEGVKLGSFTRSWLERHRSRR